MYNLLLITADQLRYDYIGAMGRQPVETPNLDFLYRNGARHTVAYSVNPLCMPARCSLLTGLYSHQHGINDNRGDLSPSLPTLPQALKRLGYQTAMIGKIHFYEGIPSALDYTLCRDEVMKLGFDHAWLTSGKSMSEFCMDDWTHTLKRKGLLERYRSDVVERNKTNSTEPTFLEEEDTVDDATVEEAARYLDSRDAEKPFSYGSPSVTRISLSTRRNDCKASTAVRSSRCPPASTETPDFIRGMPNRTLQWSNSWMAMWEKSSAN